MFIASVCLSCLKPKFDQLFCLSCLNWRNENRREEKRKEEWTSNKNLSSVPIINISYTSSIMKSISFKYFKNWRSFRLVFLHLEMYNIWFKNREKSIKTYFQNSIELHKNKNLFTSPNYWMTRESMG